jgi:thymidylate synthase (FAD)
MYDKIQVLDKGYVRLVETWGLGEAGIPEAGIIEAARQSTQGSFRGWTEDYKLLTYLYKNQHSTPFEFAGMTIEVKAPIFVFREWHRHRTQSYNEMSARYAPLPNEAYVPSIDRLLITNEANKQAGAVKGSEELTTANAFMFAEDLEDMYQELEEMYQKALSIGVPKELARLVLPVGRYTQMRATANLRNWLGFLKLRQDENAQWEIRQYANAVADIMEDEFNRTYQLYKYGEIVN